MKVLGRLLETYVLIKNHVQGTITLFSYKINTIFKFLIKNISKTINSKSITKVQKLLKSCQMEDTLGTCDFIGYSYLRFIRRTSSFFPGPQTSEEGSEGSFDDEIQEK